MLITLNTPPFSPFMNASLYQHSCVNSYGALWCMDDRKVKVKVAESCPTFLWPHGLYSPWNSPGQNAGVCSLSFLQGIIPNLGIEPRSPALQVDSLPAEPQGKPVDDRSFKIILRFIASKVFLWLSNGTSTNLPAQTSLGTSHYLIIS